jgi:methylated-DNA-protein-cysteine methyltransferase related protein
VSDAAVADPELVHRIVDVVMALGPGEVTTYGDVAADAGSPRHARLVGRVLAGAGAGDDLPEMPWWRVVNAQGRLVPGNEREHRALLLAEGVRVRAGRVVDAPVGRFARRQAGASPGAPSPADSSPDGSSPGAD